MSQSSNPLTILCEGVDAVLERKVGFNRISNSHKNASAEEFFKEGSVYYEVAKSFLLLGDRHCFVSWMNDLSLVLLTWQCSIPSDVDNTEVTSLNTIVNNICNKLLSIATKKRNWEKFYVKIDVVIREILKGYQQSEGNEEGIDKFAAFVQYKFHNYYQFGRSIRNSYCWYD